MVEINSSGIAGLREWWKLIEICDFSHVGFFATYLSSKRFYSSALNYSGKNGEAKIISN